ncbi:hypothetical protein CALVIDRAFT_537631 [Calocera viscosa TUFC12733]|uniref:COX assembly mitochondrial protein n=1 Tax=Calocera viscosa (strain TUFC12733) TaxID=1330018 RepID=A0A167LUL0_CALVF|nr:hypothetical protein CALVIDRAFT_537631 [Calocera viscosa TUFC12733]
METLSRREEETLMKVTKAKALKACDDVVREFANCATGRTVSVVWACREPHKMMQACIRQYTNSDNMERLRLEYVKLRRRDEEAIKG